MTDFYGEVERVGGCVVSAEQGQQALLLTERER